MLRGGSLLLYLPWYSPANGPGCLPKNVHEMESLPQIGRYTNPHPEICAPEKRAIQGGGRREPRRRARKKTYGPETLVPLRKIWATMDGISGNRLAPFLPEMVAVLEREVNCISPPRSGRNSFGSRRPPSTTSW